MPYKGSPRNSLLRDGLLLIALILSLVLTGVRLFEYGLQMGFALGLNVSQPKQHSEFERWDAPAPSKHNEDEWSA